MIDYTTSYQIHNGVLAFTQWIDREFVDKQWVDTSRTTVDGLPTVLTMDECDWVGVDGTGRFT